ncbi:diguanylate cyclase (GGDEF)-like protein/putative nucleotidyltransferase with HDIG domain [Effusibacillus lacus]|nr:diguanylate cyclase (GGDEF)-like protein/putative nucleotidyltransferase with HDIG domain [Effusibacillus lacus]
MKFNQKTLLNIYVISCFMSLVYLFYDNFRPLNKHEWVTIVTLAGIATLFELRSFILPSGESFTLVAPLILTVGILYGNLPVICFIFLLGVALLLQRPKNWYVHLFNISQYGLTGYLALLAYKATGGSYGELNLEDSAGYLAFVISFFLANVIFVSAYMSIRGKISLFSTLKVLLDRQATLIYVTVMGFGLILAIVLQAEGLAGAILFCAILWFLGETYRHYYEMYNHFRSLSIKDELTGLYNHRYFQEKLQELTAKGETLSLLLLDLDHFKIYNDMYGHPQGDKLLQELAKVISGNIPEQGTVYRYGGEEFAVLLPGTDSETALTVAESIRKAVSEHEFEGMKHMPAKRITVSIGVSTFPHMATSKENLLMLADEALYKIKYTSRNKVQLYTSVVDELKSHFDFGSREMELIQMIKTFLTIINSKDRYTYGHTERDMEYAEALARKIGLPEDEIKIIRYGALLHDIGKVEVPTEILNKKTKLTEQEWETMKMHVIWGEEIVKPIKELAPCLPIIRHHHERYDGKGYPDGLQGTAIPLAARILTIVDSFDAMTTNRPYQKTKTIPQAIEEIRRCSGTQFDPHLVEPFIEVIKEIRNAKIQQDVS